MCVYVCCAVYYVVLCFLLNSLSAVACVITVHLSHRLADDKMPGFIARYCLPGSGEGRSGSNILVISGNDSNLGNGVQRQPSYTNYASPYPYDEGSLPTTTIPEEQPPATVFHNYTNKSSNSNIHYSNGHAGVKKSNSSQSADYVPAAVMTSSRPNVNVRRAVSSVSGGGFQTSSASLPIATSSMTSAATTLRWLQQRQMDKDEEKHKEKNWELVARRLDCILFPIFFFICVALVVICLSISMRGQPGS